MFEGEEEHATGGESGKRGPRTSASNSMEDVGGYQHQRDLFEVFGVTDDEGALVLICGLILGGLTFTACCYLKLYDPLRLWCIKKVKKCCEKKPKQPQIEKEAPGTPEVSRRWSSIGSLPDLQAKTP